MLIARARSTFFALSLALLAAPALAAPMKGTLWMTAPEVFNPTYYADTNPDVRDKYGYDKAGLIRHWMDRGLREGRAGSPVFDVKYYLQNNPDVARSIGAANYAEAAKHWVERGIAEGRPSHPNFQVKAYLKDNPDVARSIGQANYRAAIRHYLEHGYMEGRKAQ